MTSIVKLPVLRLDLVHCVACAVAVLAVPSAQADIALSKLSSVNAFVYGRLDLSLESVSASGQPASGTISQFSRTRINSNTSFVGVRGVGELNSDLSVVGQMEAVFRPDNGATVQGTIGNRQSRLGVVSKSMGTLFLGQWDSPHKFTRYGNNPWDAWSLEGPNVLLDNGTVSAADAADNNVSFGRRLKNTIQYWTPLLGGGTQFRVALDGNETRDSTRNPRVYSFALLNNYGPLRVTLGHERHVDYQAAGKTDTSTRGLVSYDFGVAKVALFYDKITYNLAAGSLSRNAGSLGVEVPVGPGSVKFNYAVSKDGTGSAPLGTKVGSFIRGPGTGATSWALGYQWSVTKEFAVYGYVTQLDNKPNGAFDWDVNALGIGGANRGLTARAALVGAKYEF